MWRKYDGISNAMERNLNEQNTQQQSTPTWTRILEIIFGGIAKGTMAVAAVIFLLFSFPENLMTLPTTRKDLGIFLLLILCGLIGVFICWYFTGHWR